MALIGNPMDFDRIRQKYESLVYPQGRTQDTNFNRVRDSYSSLLSQPGTDPLTGQPTNMGVLTGQGSQTINRDATQGGEQVQLRFNPATGQTETIIPEYMGGFRSDQQDFLPNTSPFQTIYDVNEGMIDPVTGAPKPDPLLGTSTAVPNALPARTGGGGDGRDRLGTMQTSKGYDPYGTFDRAIGSQTESAITTALGALTGVPFGLLSGIDKQLATKQLSNTFGIDKKDIDSIQKDIESGMTTKEAMDKFRDTSEKHKVGRDFIGTGRVDPNFGMVSDDKLRELTREGEADFDAMLSDEDETTSVVNTIGDFFGNLFGGDQGGQDDKGTSTSTGSAASAAAADARDRAAREAASQPTSSPERKDVQDNKARRDAVDKMNSSKPSKTFGKGTGKGQQGQSRRGGGGGFGGPSGHGSGKQGGKHGGAGGQGGKNKGTSRF